MNNNYNPILMFFSSHDRISRKNLIHLAKNEKLVDEAINSKYIVECGKTDIGEPQYRITELGKKARDS